MHASSIGQKETNEASSVTKTDGDEVTTSRCVDKVTPPPFSNMALRGNHLPDDQPVDGWQICQFSALRQAMIEVGVALAGQGGYHADAKVKASSIVVDFVTPESDTSIWYLWGMARNFKATDKALTATLREGQGKIFSEDLDMLERQQQNLLAWPARALLKLKLNLDAGGVQARRVLDRLIAAALAGAPASPVAAT